MYSNLSGALKYAEKKRTISTNRARPLPHYQYPTNNPRNRQQIHLEVQHRPAIIHPRNNRGYRGIGNLQHYNPVYTRRQQLQHQQQQLMQQHQHQQQQMQHQQLLHLQQLQEHHKGMTDKFCRDNGYTKYVMPAPKLFTRTSPKVASNNQQKIEDIKVKSSSRSSSTSKVSSNSPQSPQRSSNKRSPTNKLPPTTKGVAINKTPKVLQTTRVAIA